ncbi:MAG: glycosyltransferase family 2 protein [Halieaceae bacterium]|jgi:glycosyltransferase involved in cell wall biosynthesis|nr:glycosyltransferase family 2 protein [Halieaceae bacterium]
MTVSATIDLRVAICVCTHSRSQGLMRLLVALQDMDLSGYNPGSVELIVVDNNPNPETEAICQRAAPRLPISVHYVTEPRSGITYARNRSVEIALERGADFVAFIDDDDQPQSDWLIQLLDRQAVTGADLVFGTWVLDSLMPQWARESGIFRSPVKAKHENKGGRYGLPGCASTCNALVGRSILQRVATTGPVFNHTFRFSGGEDKDFFIRAHELGAKLASADMSVIHRNHEPERYTASGLLMRGFKNGCSQVGMARAHGTGARAAKLLTASLAKIVMSLVLLPFSVLSKGMLMHNLYRMAKAFGVLYTAVTGRSINYYSR